MLFVVFSGSCCLRKESPWLYNWTMFACEELFVVWLNILFITPLDLYKRVFDHKPTLVTWFHLFQNQTTQYRVQIVKIYNNSGSPHKCRFLSYKKNYMGQKPPISQLAWRFKPNVKQTLRSITCDWLIFFFLSDALSSCVWSCLLDLTSLFCKMSFISILWWYQSRNRERKLSLFENGKIEYFLCRK